MKFTHTPAPNYSVWGQVDQTEEIAAGIWRVHTPSHGGLIVSPERLAAMPDALKCNVYSKGNPHAFEEDLECCLVALAFPDAFDMDQVDDAEQSIMHSGETYEGAAKWVVDNWIEHRAKAFKKEDG